MSALVAGTRLYDDSWGGRTVTTSLSRRDQLAKAGDQDIDAAPDLPAYAMCGNAHAPTNEASDAMDVLCTLGGQRRRQRLAGRLSGLALN